MLEQTTCSIKSFVQKHKVGIAITTTAVTTTAACLWLNHLALKEHNEFLKEKGLYEEFYTPEDHE